MSKPLDMILHCPQCGMQHIDERYPEGNPGWDNPPHISHTCLGCGTIWSPSHVFTNGVKRLPYHGKSDTWPHIGRKVLQCTWCKEEVGLKDISFRGSQPFHLKCVGDCLAAERDTG